MTDVDKGVQSMIRSSHESYNMAGIMDAVRGAFQESYRWYYAIPLLLFLVLGRGMAYRIKRRIQYALNEWTLPYRDLRGPTSDSWEFGLHKALMSASNGSLQAKWFSEYGLTLRYSELSQSPVILTMDPLAVDYVHRHSDIFKQKESTRLFSEEYMGPSLTAVEGMHHRRQRKAIAPSFGPHQIKIMTPDLFDKAELLVEKVRKQAGGEVNMTPLLNAMAVDAIGSAAFDADLGALRDERSDLMDAFKGLMMVNQGQGGWVALLHRLRIPLSSLLKTPRQIALDHAHDLMKGIGRKLIAEKRRAMKEEAGGNEVRKEDFASHDLFSNILRQNMAADVKEDQRMSDDEVLAQIPLFLFAGNNTVAVTLNWAVGMLAKHPECQDQLRLEAMELDSQPDWDTLNSLPYLEAFTHELIRLYPAAPTNFRVPNKQVVIPLAHPVHGRSGRLIESITVPEGTAMHLAYGNMNWSTEVFGPDAMEFDPARFLKGQKSPWEHTQSFGGGERHCIGSRFAIAELKVALFTLVRSLRFEEIESKPDFVRMGGLGAVRPKVSGKVAMPVIVNVVNE